MRDVRRVSGTVRRGAKPAFCLKHVEGATPRGRRRIASRGQSVADWLRGSQESRSNFPDDKLLAKTEINAIDFTLTESESRLAARSIRGQHEAAERPSGQKWETGVFLFESTVTH